MEEDLLKLVAKILGFIGAISFGVAAKNVIESRKQKILKKFVVIDLITAAYVGYLILPYLNTPFLEEWKGQILALTGYLGTWMLNEIIKFFKSKVKRVTNINHDDKII
jgi:hypothetical protein